MGFLCLDCIGLVLFGIFLRNLLGLVQSVVNKQWAFAIVGLYFAIMGLFALGCAGGCCYTPASNKPSEKSNHNTEYEAVKE